jgi:cytochrome c-type biogenesis protein
MDPSHLSFGIAFVAGLASFLSPCVLPLVPVYLVQLVGQSVYQASSGSEGSESIADVESEPTRLITFLHALTFVCGFSIAFVALGATASTLGRFLSAYQFQLRQIGGILLIIIGLHLMGILKLPFLYWQKRFEFHPTRPSYPASFVIGLIFAIGWTPCIGLILGPILALAANAATLSEGVFLLLAYSLGLGIPFLLLGLGLDRFSKVLKRLKPHLGKIEIVTGVVMILVGVMIYFNWLLYLNRYFNLGASI